MKWFQMILKRVIQRRMQELHSPNPPIVDTKAMQLKLTVSEERSLAKRLVDELHEDEKLSLLAGIDEF